MSYPPVPPPRQSHEAGPSSAPARPTNRPRSSTTHSATKPRTLTLHPNSSSANLLFNAPSGALPSARNRGHARHHSNSDVDEQATPKRQHRATFLHEETYEDTEQVDLPNFGHMLGFDEGEDHFAVAAGMRTRWKRKLYLLMEEPSSGREAFFLHVLVTGAILFSAILTTLSTMPAFHTEPLIIKALFGLDTTIVVLFTIEYIARSLAHTDSWTHYYSWATSFFAIIDLVAILPYYVEVAQNQDTTILFRFSILRTFRLLRVFRAFKYQNQMLLTIEVMYVAVRRSRDALYALMFFIVLVLVLFATLIYFAERGTWDASVGYFIDADGDPSAFDSIPKTAWFALVTMSTVGYGEVVPKSFLGKLLTVPLLMFGLLLIALPSFVLGRNFAIVYDAFAKQLFQGNVSVASSPRQSLDQPTSIPNPGDDDVPLLPISNPPETSPPSTTVHSRARSVSPLPPGGNAQGQWAGQGGSQPKMWDGGMDGTGAAAGERKERDLTNTKLAKNQLVLLEQIDSLRQTIDSQGEMLRLLTQALGVQNGEEEGARRTGSRKGKEKSTGGEFKLDDSDDE
ncbi:hypothetical protein L202_08005 [Cryptococcus amylolentus CBS 6039]|uniref:Ion transport domain-containing protein n=2 Tax=Cryptococcus amylolentus TaxID=104669 RepID=A0A1E3HAY3_9TREE|nr:hypothetical protein L202_08005 [Cryptococcus amylolentus CBS 6039]ODN73502.1 hypothetical protein L202_08005 [Cryptococcus amylolentus CBS 6039]ODN99252.1 hypothetical protein I350_07411 [Cryptococcus amylolentus CBS 6273]